MNNDTIKSMLWITSSRSQGAWQEKKLDYRKSSQRKENWMKLLKWLLRSVWKISRRSLAQRLTAADLRFFSMPAAWRWHSCQVVAPPLRSNFSTTIRWIVVKLCRDIHAAQRINPINSFVVFNEIYHQLFDRLPWNLVQTFRPFSGWFVKTLAILWLLILHYHRLKVVQYFSLWLNTCTTNGIPIILSFILALVVIRKW